MPKVCCRSTGFYGWLGWGTSLIYTCLRGGSLPGSPERSYSRTKGLVLFPILLPFGSAHPFSSHPSSHPCSTYPGYLPFKYHASPHSASHPPITSPTRQPPSFSHPSTPFHTHPPSLRLPLISQSICLSLNYSCVHPGFSFLFDLPSRPPTHQPVYSFMCCAPAPGWGLGLKSFCIWRKYEISPASC